MRLPLTQHFTLYESGTTAAGAAFCVLFLQVFQGALLFLDQTAENYCICGRKAHREWRTLSKVSVTEATTLRKLWCMTHVWCWRLHLLLVLVIAAWSFFGWSSTPWNTCQSMQCFAHHGLRQAYKTENKTVLVYKLSPFLLFSVLYAWRSPRWAKRCIDWQVFHGVLDRPKKDQTAINSACLITFTMVLWCNTRQKLRDAATDCV